MSYNGIGLPTPRGTGTSGYVQKNTSSLNSTAWSRKGVYAKRQELQKLNENRQSKFLRHNIATRQVDQGIIDHEKKRKIEIECVKLRAQLEDDREEQIETGEDEDNLLTDEQIEQQVAQLRERLKKEENQKNERSRRYSDDKYGKLSSRFKQSDSKKDRRDEDYSDGKSAHSRALEKARDNDKFKKALEWSEETKRQSKTYRRRERSLSPIRSSEEHKEHDRKSSKYEHKYSSNRNYNSKSRNETEGEDDYYHRRKNRDDRGRYYSTGIGKPIDYDGYKSSSKETGLVDRDSPKPTISKEHEEDGKKRILSKPLAPYREIKTTIPDKPVKAETSKSTDSTNANLPEKPSSNTQSDSDSNDFKSDKAKEESMA